MTGDVEDQGNGLEEEENVDDPVPILPKGPFNREQKKYKKKPAKVALFGASPLRSWKEIEVKANTGVSLAQFQFFSKLLGEKLPSTRVNRDTKLLMFFMKLKQVKTRLFSISSCKNYSSLSTLKDLTFLVMGSWFNISNAGVGKIFEQVLDIFHQEVRSMVHWLDKDTIQAKMPAAFKALNENIRCIVDCPESYCEKPAGIESQVQFYSNYRSHFTVKFLIAIAPHGFIMFISEAYGGKTLLHKNVFL